VGLKTHDKFVNRLGVGFFVLHTGLLGIGATRAQASAARAGVGSGKYGWTRERKQIEVCDAPHYENEDLETFRNDTNYDS
jgi:hypothetical protein